MKFNCGLPGGFLESLVFRKDQLICFRREFKYQWRDNVMIIFALWKEKKNVNLNRIELAASSCWLRIASRINLSSQ